MIKKRFRNFLGPWSFFQRRTPIFERFAAKAKNVAESSIQVSTVMVIVYLVSFTLMGSQHALALEGFNPKMVEKFLELQTAQVDPTFGLLPQTAQSVQQVIEAAAVFRTTAAFDIQRLPKSFPETSQEVFSPFFSGKDAENLLSFWAYFFRGSMITIGNSASLITRIGFYNPLVDGWVMTDWLRDIEVSKGPELLGIGVLPGEAIHGELPQEGHALPWMQIADQTIPGAIAAKTQQSLTAFKELYPPVSEQSVDPILPLSRNNVGQILVEGRIATIFANFLNADQLAVKEATTSLLEQIRDGEFVDLQNMLNDHPSQPLRLISNLPSMFRNQLELTGVITTSKGWALTFGVPFSGRWLLVAEYRQGNRGESFAIEGVAITDLKPQEQRGFR